MKHFRKLLATQSDAYRAQRRADAAHMIVLFFLAIAVLFFLAASLSRTKVVPSAADVAKPLDLRLVRVTVYIDKGTMASGKTVYDGAAACPRSWKLGTKFELNGRVFTCEDRTAKWVETKFEYPTVDIWKDITYKQAKIEGVNHKVIEVLK